MTDQTTPDAPKNTLPNNELLGSRTEPKPLSTDEQTERYLKIVHQALEDIKAQNIVEFDVKNLTNVTDSVVIASGTSTRHVKALADNVAEEIKKAGLTVLGVEGQRDSDWILIDLANVIVHVMLPSAREFYDLESLWSNAQS